MRGRKADCCGKRRGCARSSRTDDVRLKDIEPMAYNFLLNFAKDNELETRHGRVEERHGAG
jgi:hypothetical protein